MKKQTKEFFPGISKIQYEGSRSKNPLAFKHYNPGELVEGKTMKEHLRFSVTYEAASEAAEDALMAAAKERLTRIRPVF